MDALKKALADGSIKVLPNGVIVVARKLKNPTKAYKPTEIPDILSLVDHSLRCRRRDYDAQIEGLRAEYNSLLRQLKDLRLTHMCALQGPDGAGKTGQSKEFEFAVHFDHKIMKICPFGVPTDEERARPYLWKYMRGRNMPEFGTSTVLDRYWLERLLVERVEGLISAEELEASYPQVTTFEWMLRHAYRTVLTKHFLSISKETQKKRFAKRKKERKEKLSKSDGIARKKWDLYVAADNEAIWRTGTVDNPHTIIPADDKRHAHICIFTYQIDVLKARIAEAQAELAAQTSITGKKKK